MLAVLVLNSIIMVGVIVLGIATFQNTMAYKKTVYRFLDALLRMKTQKIEQYSEQFQIYAMKFSNIGRSDLLSY